MANKVYNMEGGLHSAAAYSAFENSMWGSCVASSSDFVATAGTGMNISLSAGNGMIDTGLGFSRRIASDAVNTISVDAASSANPRKDALVAYIDNGVTPTTSVLDNTNDILKFACVAGSPAATPAAPSDATIQTAIGAGNPYVVLWYVTVPKSATSLSTATFTDNRNISSKIDGSNIKDGTVTSSKIDWTTSISNHTATLNSSYFSSGTVRWTRFGNLVIITFSDLRLSATPPSGSGSIVCSGLPAPSNGFNTFVLTNRLEGKNLRLAKNSSDAIVFHYTDSSGQIAAELCGQYIYPTAS